MTLHTRPPSFPCAGPASFAATDHGKYDGGAALQGATLDLNFLLATSALIGAATSVGPTLTFTRASNAMVWNEGGELQYAPHQLLENANFHGASAGVPPATDAAPSGWTKSVVAGSVGLNYTDQGNYFSMELVGTGGYRGDVENVITVPEANSIYTFGFYLDITDSGTLTASDDVAEVVDFGAPAVVELPFSAYSIPGFYALVVEVDADVAGKFRLGGQTDTTEDWTAEFSRPFVVKGDVYNLGADNVGGPFTAEPLGLWVGTDDGDEPKYDHPRFDHDPAASNAALGLLIEEARTNNQLHSDDWTNAAYTATNITAAKDATGPDGVANSASTLTADANNGDIIQTITLGSAEYTTSVFMKRKTGTGTVEITDNDFTNATDITADINSSTWTQVGNITRTQANPVVGIRLGTSGDEVEVALGQCEAGAFMSSGIPTTTAAVTRAADVCSASDMSWYNDNEGTLFAQGRVPILYTAASYIVFAGASGSNNCNIQRISTSTLRHEHNTSTGNDGRSNIAAALSAETVFKSAVRIANDDLNAAVDGSAGAADTSCTVPASTLISTGSLVIGNDLSGNEWNGHVQVIKYWGTPYTDTQLEGETAL